MPSLEVGYSHSIEQRVFNNFKVTVEKLGLRVSDLTAPVEEITASEAIEKLICEWGTKERSFVNQLSRFYSCNFDLAGWTAYLSRFPIYPYWTSEKWFTVPFGSIDKQLKTIGHELFHQPFHLYWQKKCEGVFKEVKNPRDAKENLVVRSLKEALPELLNTPEFKISDVVDDGHPEPCEQLLRYAIRKHYANYGPFTFEEFLKVIS